MRFIDTAIAGVQLIELAPHVDERGAFERTYCEQTFAAHGLNTWWPQCNRSLTKRRGTIRGLHFQIAPHEEVKVVRCTAGRIWDVAVDLRPESATFLRYVGVELAHDNHLSIYLPAGVAHGFQCLSDDCDVAYMMSTPYAASHARGLRWNDPALAIPWPLTDPVLSEKDRLWPTLADTQ